MIFSYEITTPRGELLQVSVDTDTITDSDLANDATLLQAAKDYVISLVMARYVEQEQNLFSYMNYDIQADKDSQVMMVTQLSLGETSWSRIGFWKTYTNDKVTMSFAQLGEMCDLLNLRNSILFNTKDTLKIQVGSAATVADFQAVYDSIDTIDSLQANYQALSALSITSVSPSAPAQSPAP